MFTAIVLAATIDLHSELAKVAAEHHLPAISATVTNADGVIAHGVAGVRRVDQPAEVMLDDAFHIGSITKPFLATIAGMLVEEKKLSWETKITDVFPEWKTTMRPEFAGVTLAQLLAHESGLPEFGDTEDFAKMPGLHGSPIEHRRQFAQWALSLSPVAKPGTEFHYSNAGYTVAAAMIENVSRTSWDELVQKRIFDPLHMSTAGVGWPSRVWGHILAADGKQTPVDPKGSYQLKDIIAPAGDLHMSSDDLAFLREHLRAMRGERSFISSAMSATIHTKRIKTGLGFGVATFAGFENVATHSGSADTFVTVIAIAAKQNVAVCVSTNVAGDEVPKAVGMELRDLLTRFAQ